MNYLFIYLLDHSDGESTDYGCLRKSAEKIILNKNYFVGDCPLFEVYLIFSTFLELTLKVS
jgi:hypothetical protein